MKSSKLTVSKSLQTNSSINGAGSHGDSELITRNELMLKLKTSSPTLYRMEKKGIVPHTIWGGQKRYNWNKVCEALEKLSK